MSGSIRALVGGALVILGAVGVVATGCGQAVATCGSLCPSACGGGDCPRSPEAEFCPTGCAALEASCTASGHEADLQLYLTCLANAGGYELGQSACAGVASAVEASCVGVGATPGTGAGGGTGTGVGTGTGTGVGTGTGTGSGSGSDEICVTLGPCCSSLPEPDAEECMQAVATSNQAACITFLQDVGGGFCEGPGFGGCVAGTPCASGDACGSNANGCDVSCMCVDGSMACTGSCP